MKKSLKFVYKLNYDEIYEAFYVLNMKWGKGVRNVLTVILTVIAIGMLMVYYMDSQKIHCFLLAVFAILLLYCIIYVPVLKARKGAKKVSEKKGTYKVELTWEGKIISGTEIIELAADKDARAIETENIFVIRPDNIHTFCLPKRIITNKEIDEIRKLLHKYMKVKD